VCCNLLTVTNRNWAKSLWGRDAFSFWESAFTKSKEDSGLSSKHNPSPQFTNHLNTTIHWGLLFPGVLCTAYCVPFSSLPSPFLSPTLAFQFPQLLIPFFMAQISPSPTLSPTMSTPPCQDQSQEPTMDFNVMVIVAAMICALVCALGLNSMLQCVFQCTRRAVTEPAGWISSRRRNSGLKKKEMVALPTSTYAHQGSPSSASGCAICLADFTDGDKIRVLPKCNHRFHADCIDKWLLSHSSCPTCRHRLKSNESVPSLEQIVTA